MHPNPEQPKRQEVIGGSFVLFAEQEQTEEKRNTDSGDIEHLSPGKMQCKYSCSFGSQLPGDSIVIDYLCRIQTLVFLLMQQFIRLSLIPFFAFIFLIPKTFAQTLTIVPASSYDSCAPFPLTLRADTTGIGIVEWPDGSKADTFVINDYGTYSATLTTLDTTLTDEFTISKIDCCYPVIANAFTPNGDGVNDDFGVRLKYCEVQILEFTVYSRWGELMFQAIRSTDRWDGLTLNGTEAPSDVYVYVTRFKVADEEEEKTQKGDVTLLR